MAASDDLKSSSARDDFTTIPDQRQADGHGAFQRLTPVPLGPWGGAVRPKAAPKPWRAKSDGEA